MLDERKSAILQALVEEYIRTGEPVSSRAVLDCSGLEVSSATVRNDLKVLEDDGYVVQPHTSAGRIPTNLGFRYYVDHISPGRLHGRARSRISQFFSSMHQELGRMLQETSNLLADLTEYPAVVLGPGMAADTVHAIHLVSLADRAVLAVVVAETGRVSKELVKLRRPVDERSLENAEELLNRVCSGVSVTEGVAATAKLGSDVASPETVEIARAVGRALGRTEDRSRELYLGGTARLASIWADLSHVHRMLELMERDAQVYRLLEASAAEPSVRLGSDLSEFEDLDAVGLAVVSARYEAGHGTDGAVGVFGPTRMDYKRTIKVIEEVRDGLSDSLGH